MSNRHWLRWLLTALLVAVLVLSSMLVYEIKSPWFPRIGLPAFDHEKVKQLTPEKRAAYEQELFGELEIWNRGSPKYPAPDGGKKRDERWLEMANDGFELAHLTMQILQPTGGRIHRARASLERLDKLASQGDRGAMCVLPYLTVMASHTQELNQSLRSAYHQWMAKGASLNHPQCLIELGDRLILGVDGYVRDAEKGADLNLAARKAGYLNNLGPLISYFREKGPEDLEAVRREYCWTQISESLRGESGVANLILVRVRTLELHRRKRDLALLIEELSSQILDSQRCLNLGKH